MSARDVITEFLRFDIGVNEPESFAGELLAALGEAGFAVVPKEPTVAMFKRFKKQTGSDAHMLAANFYKAMLKAAKETP